MNSIHVWYLSTDRTSEPRLAAWTRTLSDDERQRSAEFRFEKDRRAYVAAHGLVRAALSRYLRQPPEQLRFHKGPYGRPEISGAAACSGLRFSLTHTDGLVACAVARSTDIGVDVEATTRPAPFEVMARCFAPAERSALAALPAEQQPERFYVHWTLKEAFLKATGRGLSDPMDRVAFTVRAGNAPRADALPEHAGSRDAWQFGSWCVEDRFRVALAVRCGDAERRVKIRRWRSD